MTRLNGSCGCWGTILLVTMSCVLAGCTSMPVRIPTSKSAQVMRFDADRDVVVMGASYTYLEKVTVDWAAARAEAAGYCQKFKGFSNAEPVGTTRRECLNTVGTDCVRYAMIGDYRCSD